MPIRYGVLKGKAIDRRMATRENAHYQVHVTAGEEHFRIAVNVKSQLHPSELLYLTNEHFAHEVTDALEPLPFGFTKLESRPGGAALDFIRSNLFHPKDMVPLAFDIPGQDNDLNEKLDFYIRRAMEVEDAVLYAFGEEWGPEPTPDKIFGFRPGRGVHDIHMNQGNDRTFRKDDGVYQDGALLIHFPSEGRWIAIFLAFQSQAWHTDDVTGHALETGPSPSPVPSEPSEPAIPAPPSRGPGSAKDGPVYIAGAVVKPGDAPAGGRETVTLLNASDEPVDLTGWTLANKSKQKYGLSGSIMPGQFLTIALDRAPGGQEFLRNRGDIITLQNAQGLKLHGVAYTRSQVKAGWTVKF